ncbi:hypothetical protein B0J12DRAFT_577841 [Macrophomina phaseolina]|uniref:Rhodopsin domain-containing protein n=1 Tax=Macrophomina phaseolina TaxID=35725 RepID=A0ABQ8G4H5_9PEZI|nr:hypothetical protein B0J12DRAFT_577841 [Macrophomina phaseolina]
MTPEQEAAFLTQNRQGEVYAVHITFFVLMLLAVYARYTSARMAQKPLSWDDWFAFAAAVNTVGVFIGTMLWLRFGLGKHAVAVAQEDPENVTRFFKTIVANEMLYTTGLACSRLSLVALYYRLFGVSSMRYFLHVFVFIIIAWAISTYIPSIRTCWPIESFWDGTNQNCIDLFKFYVGVAIGSIITDVGLMILPLPYIWRLNVPRYRKILIACTLVFGGFACFVTIIRLTKIVSLDLSDPTWGTVDLMIWTGLEVYCAVICCCLPTLRALTKAAGRFFGISNWTSTPANSHPERWSNPRGPAVYSKKPAGATHSSEEILGDQRTADLELSKYGYVNSRNGSL